MKLIAIAEYLEKVLYRDYIVVIYMEDFYSSRRACARKETGDRYEVA